MSENNRLIEHLKEQEGEFANHPIGVEPDPTTGGWVVMDGDTFRPIAVRQYRPAAEAIARKANGMSPKPGDEYLLSQEPHGDEYGPNFKEPACAVL